jgi:hypothetical protein
VRLFYDQGHYTAFEPLGAGDLAARALSKAKFPPGIKPLVDENVFTRLTVS